MFINYVIIIFIIITIYEFIKAITKKYTYFRIQESKKYFNKNKNEPRNLM